MHRPRVMARTIFLLTGLAALAACTDTDGPSTARVVVQAAPASPLVLIVSTSFTVVRDPEDGGRDAVLLVADSLELTGGYDEEIDIRETGRVFVRVRNDEAVDELVEVRVLIDGQERFHSTDRISDGRDVEFFYTSFGAS